MKSDSGSIIVWEAKGGHRMRARGTGGDGGEYFQEVRQGVGGCGGSTSELSCPRGSGAGVQVIQNHR